jgi:hypothetical protein
MTRKEVNEIIETTSEEMLSILTSMKGVLTLSEHYANPPETIDYLAMLSSCITRLEAIVQATKVKIQDKS